jgi:hypothetical protein
LGGIGDRNRAVGSNACRSTSGSRCGASSILSLPELTAIWQSTTVEANTFIKLKAKCLACNLHFVVCTEHPERHSTTTLHCPECGQHDGAFFTWSEAVAEPIYNEVPGQAAATPDMEIEDIREIDIGDFA